MNQTRTARLAVVGLLLLPAVPAPAQPAQASAPSVILGNDKIGLRILTTGGRFSKLVLRDGLFALDAATGKVVWHTPPPKPSCAGREGCSGAQRSPPTIIPGVVFSPSMDGHIRAFRISNGEIVWDFDAVRDYKTLNGIPGRGAPSVPRAP